jgi:hypothetical protein
MFAVALTLVVIVSAAVLLWQYRTGALLIDDSSPRGDARGDAKAAAPEPIGPAATLHVDHAA